MCQIPERAHMICAPSILHTLILDAWNAPSFSQFNSVKSLFCTCLRSLVFHFGSQNTQNLLTISKAEKVSQRFSLQRLNEKRLFSTLSGVPLFPGCLISTYNKFIGFIAHRKEWLNLSVWKEMRVLNVWRHVSAAHSVVVQVLKWHILFSIYQFFFQYQGHWMSQSQHNHFWFHCHW